MTRLTKVIPAPSGVVVKDQNGALMGVGIKHSENRSNGIFLTADLCPSAKPLDRDFFEQIISTSKTLPVPIGLSVSGLWLRAHEKDFDWLKKQIEDHRLKITWINHSYTHPYRNDLPNSLNFLRTAGALNYFSLRGTGVASDSPFSSPGD